MGMSANYDVDYIIWGPFDSPICNYDSLSIENIIDCEYTSTNHEWPEIGPNSSEGPTTAIVGKYYMMLITNYSQVIQDFTIEQINIGEPGAGSTNCEIVCPLLYNLSFSIDNCDFSQNGNEYFTQYKLLGEIDLTNSSPIDSLIINLNTTYSQTLYAPSNQVIQFEFENLNSNASSNELEVSLYKSDGTYCSTSNTYTAPLPINIYSQNICQNSNLGSIVADINGFNDYFNTINWSVGASDEVSNNVFVLDSLSAGNYSVTITTNSFPSCEFIIEDILIEDMGEDCSIVSGYSFADIDSNCIYNSNDIAIPNTILWFEPINYYTFTNQYGFYSIALPYGEYTISEGGYPFIEPSCITIQPLVLTTSDSEGQVFFDIANDPFLFASDLAVSSSSTIARPGFETQQNISIHNFSFSDIYNSEISLHFNSILIYQNTFDLQPESVSSDSINWVIPHLGPFETIDIHVRFSVIDDVNLLDDTLFYSINSNLSGGLDDYILENNYSQNYRIIQGSFDPNFVEINNVPNQAEIYLEDSSLTYTIHFQNTGTDTAFNVVVVDTIPEELDLLSFVTGSSSHPYTYEIEAGRKLKFTFNNIFLPDSNINEAMSHAFVSFSIRQNETNQVGDFITNKADIYFDFNDAITTELLETEIVDNNVSIEIKNKVSNIHIFPNPAKSTISISFTEQQSGTVQIFNLSGQVVLQQSFKNSIKDNINIETLNNGAYLVKIQTLNNTRIEKLIIE